MPKWPLPEFQIFRCNHFTLTHPELPDVSDGSKGVTAFAKTAAVLNTRVRGRLSAGQAYTAKSADSEKLRHLFAIGKVCTGPISQVQRKQPLRGLPKRDVYIRPGKRQTGQPPHAPQSNLQSENLFPDRGFHRKSQSIILRAQLQRLLSRITHAASLLRRSSLVQ